MTRRSSGEAYLKARAEGRGALVGYLPVGYPSVAGGAKDAQGVTEHAAEVGEAVAAITGYSALVEAEAAIAFGALVKVGTDGKAITGTAADHCGRALGAATQAGQLIEVQLYKHVHA